MKTLIINFKNYPEALGEGSVRLAQAAAKASPGGVEIVVAPPTPMISLVSSKVDIQVFSQSLGSQAGDKTTGAVTAESVRAAGASGTLLNHSEARIPLSELGELVPRAKRAGLRTCVCANGTEEALTLSSFGSEFLAVEPPELIGSGVAVSKAKPEVVSSTVRAVREAGYGGRVLCGAGIVDGSDVLRAVELGAEGVLVSSSVVKAGDWEAKIRELSRSLV